MPNDKNKGNTSNRGFGSMDQDKQREIASKGGKAAHASGNAHQFDSEEAAEAGRKGGQGRSQSSAQQRTQGTQAGNQEDTQGGNRQRNQEGRMQACICILPSQALLRKRALKCFLCKKRETDHASAQEQNAA